MSRKAEEQWRRKTFCIIKWRLVLHFHDKMSVVVYLNGDLHIQTRKHPLIKLDVDMETGLSEQIRIHTTWKLFQIRRMNV